MRIMSTRNVAVTALLTLALTATPSWIVQAAVKAGGSCTVLGKVSTLSHSKFTCIKSGKKLVWSKPIKVAVTTPVPPSPVVATPTVSNPDNSTPTLFQSEGCHAKVSASLQKKVGDLWVDVTDAQGWEKVASCDADHPYEPYARVYIPNGTIVRWKVYVPGGWEWFSTSKIVKSVVASTVGEKIPAISADKYSQVLLIARSAVTSEMPMGTNTTAATFTFEDSIFPIERTVIKNGVEKTLAHYSPYLDPALNVHIFVFGTSTFLRNEAPKADPTNKEFADDMARQALTWGFRTADNCIGMGGFAVPEVPFPFIAIDAPCKNNDPAAYGVLPHELTHILQIKFGSANPRCWAPTWLVEGQAQVGATTLAVSENGGASDVHRKSWVDRIVKPTSIADITAMEGDTKDFSEYTLGAALSEYLVAKGGWKRSLNLYTQAANQSASACLSDSAKLTNFNNAFLSLYGESVNEFYNEALPYLQWVVDHR